jgi:hypothetical protein
MTRWSARCSATSRSAGGGGTDGVRGRRGPALAGVSRGAAVDGVERPSRADLGRLGRASWLSGDPGDDSLGGEPAAGGQALRVGIPRAWRQDTPLYPRVEWGCQSHPRSFVRVAEKIHLLSPKRWTRGCRGVIVVESTTTGEFVAGRTGESWGSSGGPGPLSFHSRVPRMPCRASEGPDSTPTRLTAGNGRPGLGTRAQVLGTPGDSLQGWNRLHSSARSARIGEAITCASRARRQHPLWNAGPSRTRCRRRAPSPCSLRRAGRARGSPRPGLRNRRFEHP